MSRLAILRIVSRFFMAPSPGIAKTSGRQSYHAPAIYDCLCPNASSDVYIIEAHLGPVTLRHNLLFVSCALLVSQVETCSQIDSLTIWISHVEANNFAIMLNHATSR